MSGSVLVTGGGTGIGRACALALAAAGDTVYVAGRRLEPLQSVVDEAAEAAGIVVAIQADASTVEGAARVADAVTGCRAIVAAAGGLSPSPGAGATLAQIRDQWQHGFESNVLSSVLVVEALRDQLDVNAGRVVLISSIAALRGSGGGPYGSMKAAVHGYMYDLARELGAHGGTANVIAPGFVPDTEFWAGRLSPETIESRVAPTLVGRGGSTEEVASLIGWLLGPDGSWVTGQVISPNGGAVLGR